MATFTFTTDNVAEAQAIINALGGNVNATAVIGKEFDINTPTETDVTPDTQTTRDTDARVTPTMIASDIAGIIKALANMDEYELTETFGDEYNKPYRVLKAFSYEDIAKKIDFESIPTNANLDDINEIIDYIIKDVSIGGMSHNTMKNIFGVRTSKKLFRNFSLDEIVQNIKDFRN